MTVIVFVHIYYDDSLREIECCLDKFAEKYPCKYFFNVCTENPNHVKIIDKISKLPNTVVLKSPNKGKDIGGKLLLINEYLKMNIQSDFMIFLHDKKSPQLIDGKIWKNFLFSIIEPEKLNEIERKFKNPKIGMIGSKAHLVNTKREMRSEIFMGNETVIMNLAHKYNLHSKNLAYISGTMFWVRSKIFEWFFTKHNPLDIRKDLETGNVLDNYGPTKTHSWERLLGWIVSSQGYTIEGI